MPTYEYRREDGTTFEIQQRITEDPLETCPETGQDVERIISGGSGLIFKGDGFYVNDYGSGSSSPSTSNGDDNSSDASSDSTEPSSAVKSSSTADSDS
jgi:putative FmdB family regulatory protein